MSECSVPLNNQQRAVLKALEKTQFLLNQNSGVSYDDIHSAKSILYAAIEQVGMKAERFFSAQRMLRELFAIVSTKADLREYEKTVGVQIIDDLLKRYGAELIGKKIEISGYPEVPSK